MEEMYGERQTDMSKWPTAKQLYTHGWGVNEQVWESFFLGMEFIPGMTLNKYPQNGLKRAPEEEATTSNNFSMGMMDRYKIQCNANANVKS